MQPRWLVARLLLGVAVPDLGKSAASSDLNEELLIDAYAYPAICPRENRGITVVRYTTHWTVRKKQWPVPFSPAS